MPDIDNQQFYEINQRDNSGVGLPRNKFRVPLIILAVVIFVVSILALLYFFGVFEKAVANPQEVYNPGKDNEVIEECVDQECLDKQLRDSAFAKKSYQLCAGIVSSVFKEECESVLIVGVLESGACVENGIDQTYCDSTKLFDDAIKSSDLSKCNLLDPESEKELCEVAFKVRDLDDDGLTDYDEIVNYKTDPENSDTDGDGYLDGEEVAGGFDPLN